MAVLERGESWLMLWNPEMDPKSGKEFNVAKSNGSEISLWWIVPFGQQKKGDLFFMKCSSKGQFPGIFAMGVCDEDKDPRKKNPKGLRLRFLKFLDDESVISNSELKKIAPSILQKVGSGTITDSKMTATLRKLFEERLKTNSSPNTNTHIEGQLREVKLTTRERNQQARRECLEHYGDEVCRACDVNLVALFGEIGRILHVHHREDLALKSGPTTVSGKDDLIPVCPNCHAMLHFKKPAMPVEELRMLFKSSRE